MKNFFLIKSLSWRLIGTIDLLIVSLIITGNSSYGISISFIDFLSKIFLYYFHEKVWSFSKFKVSDFRHLIKSFSWRCFATLFTLIMTNLLIGNVYLSLKIITLEFFTKMFLYFIHEKIWYSKYFTRNVRK